MLQCSCIPLWEVPVNLFPIQAANECDLVFGEADSDAVITRLNTIVIFLRRELFGIRNRLQALGNLNSLNQLCNRCENRFALN